MQQQSILRVIVRRQGGWPIAQKPHNETADGHRERKVNGSIRSALWRPSDQERITSKEQGESGSCSSGAQGSVFRSLP